MASASSGLRHPASASCLGRHSRLAGRCPNNSSLFPPLAAVVVVASHNQRKDHLYFAILENLRIFQNCLFTGGVVKENGICSAAFCESAALREVPPQSAHYVRIQLPQGDAFALCWKPYRCHQKPSPWGRWLDAKRQDGRGSPTREKGLAERPQTLR